MTSDQNQSQDAPPTAPEDAMSDANRRGHPRVNVSVGARFMDPSGAEYRCTVRDFSLNGVAFDTDSGPAKGDNIIAYIDNLGRFEGPVTRLFDGGFAIQVDLKGSRLDRVASKLVDHTQGKTGTADLPPNTTNLDTSSHLIMPDGQSQTCTVIDMSLSGAIVATDTRPQKGTHVDIGKMHGRVVDHTPSGIVIAFDDIPPKPKAAQAHLG